MYTVSNCMRVYTDDINIYLYNTITFLCDYNNNNKKKTVHISNNIITFAES